MTILIGFYLFHLLEGPLHWPCGDCGGCPAEDGNFILTHGHVEEGRLSDSPVSKFVKAPGGPPTLGYWPSSLREWAFKQAHRILIGRGPLPVVLVAFGLWPPPNWYFTLALIPRHPSFNRTQRGTLPRQPGFGVHINIWVHWYGSNSKPEAYSWIWSFQEP